MSGARYILEWYKGAVEGLRNDQQERVWHLMRSWGVRSGILAESFARIARRAVKNTLNNLP